MRATAKQAQTKNLQCTRGAWNGLPRQPANGQASTDVPVVEGCSFFPTGAMRGTRRSCQSNVQGMAPAISANAGCRRIARYVTGRPRHCTSRRRQARRQHHGHSPPVAAGVRGGGVDGCGRRWAGDGGYAVSRSVTVASPLHYSVSPPSHQECGATISTRADYACPSLPQLRSPASYREQHYPALVGRGFPDDTNLL